MHAIKELLGLAFLAWPLVLIGIILLAFILAIIVGVIFARRTKRSQWRWALIGFLAVYLMFFWDWIPTIALHKYYCEKDAGFWVYKTVDQWKSENPGVAETLVANKLPVVVQNAFVLNQRFNWVIEKTPFSPINQMIREEQRVVDTKTGEVLARYVDYSTSQTPRQAGWSGWKFWLNYPHCVGGERAQNMMRQFKNEFRGAER